MTLLFRPEDRLPPPVAALAGDRAPGVFRLAGDPLRGGLATRRAARASALHRGRRVALARGLTPCPSTRTSKPVAAISCGPRPTTVWRCAGSRARASRPWSMISRPSRIAYASRTAISPPMNCAPFRRATGASAPPNWPPTCNGFSSQSSSPRPCSASVSPCVPRSVLAVARPAARRVHGGSDRGVPRGGKSAG